MEKIKGTQLVKIQVDKGEMESEIKFNMPLKIIKLIFSYFHFTRSIATRITTLTCNANKEILLLISVQNYLMEFYHVQ